MPNSPSAIKRLRQSKKRRLQNRIAKKLIKTYTKRCLSAANAGEFAPAEADFRTAVAKLDKASARRILHPNTVRRRKSSLTKSYSSAVATAKAKG